MITIIYLLWVMCLRVVGGTSEHGRGSATIYMVVGVVVDSVCGDGCAGEM